MDIASLLLPVTVEEIALQGAAALLLTISVVLSLVLIVPAATVK